MTTIYDAVYEFTAYNCEKIYGWGSENEAQLYLGWLNEKREINQYEMAESDLTEDLGLIEAGDN